MSEDFGGILNSLVSRFILLELLKTATRILLFMVAFLQNCNKAKGCFPLLTETASLKASRPWSLEES